MSILLLKLIQTGNPVSLLNKRSRAKMKKEKVVLGMKEEVEEDSSKKKANKKVVTSLKRQKRNWPFYTMTVPRRQQAHFDDYPFSAVTI